MHHFKEFEDYRDADDAVYELNEKELLGSKIILDHARPNRSGFGGRRESGAGRRYSRFLLFIYVKWIIWECYKVTEYFIHIMAN